MTVLLLMPSALAVWVQEWPAATMPMACALMAAE
jgi:hypothetical protein